MRKIILAFVLTIIAFTAQAQEKNTGHTIKIGNYELYSSVIHYNPEKGGGIYEVVSPKISIQEEYILYDHIRDHKEQIEEKLGVVIYFTKASIYIYDRKTYEQYWENEKQRMFSKQEEETKRVVENLNSLLE